MERTKLYLMDEEELELWHETAELEDLDDLTDREKACVDTEVVCEILYNTYHLSVEDRIVYKDQFDIGYDDEEDRFLDWEAKVNRDYY